MAAHCPGRAQRYEGWEPYERESQERTLARRELFPADRVLPTRSRAARLNCARSMDNSIFPGAQRLFLHPSDQVQKPTLIDSKFLVLCVVLMYMRLSIQGSPERAASIRKQKKGRSRNVIVHAIVPHSGADGKAEVYRLESA